MSRGIAILLCVGFSAGTAHAEWPGQQMSIMQANPGGISTPYGLAGGGGTPTMRRQKLEQSADLRKEAHQLEAADGGTLSAEHVAYIKKRVRQIMGRNETYVRTGTLVAGR